MWRLWQEIVRFGLGGLFNLAFCYAVYLAALLAVTPPLAFTISYISGILVSYLVNSTYVFRTRPSLGTGARFLLVYVVHYGSGVAMVSAFPQLLNVSAQSAGLIAMVAGAALSYLLQRAIVFRPG